MSVSGPKKEECAMEFGGLRGNTESRIGSQSIRIQLRHRDEGLYVLRSRAMETGGLLEDISQGHGTL